MCDRRDNSEYQEIHRVLDVHTLKLDSEDAQHASIIASININTRNTLALSTRFDEFETKMLPLINVIDGLVILGEIGNSSATKGVKVLVVFLSAVGILAGGLWYALKSFGEFK